MKKINKLLLFLVICIAVVFFIAYFYYYENAKNQYVPEDNEIKVIDAFFKIEGGFTRTSVKYPVICPESDEVNEKINRRIYNAVITKDLTEYTKYPNHTEISYETTLFNEQVLNVHLKGDGDIIGSPMFFDKGMLFDLKTGEILGLDYFYEPEDIKSIISSAWEKDKVQVDLPVTKDSQDEIIGEFIKLFESSEYCSQTDNFFIKDGYF